MTSSTLSKEQIGQCLVELNRVSNEEYGCDLTDVLNDPDRDLGAKRLRRMTGIMLKRGFATSAALERPSPETGARQAWNWDPAKMENPVDPKSDEFVLLDHVRAALPKLAGRSPTWSALRNEADHERGLFKVLSGYVEDKLSGRDSKSIRAYFDAPESKNRKALLDLGTVVFDLTVTPLLMGIIGPPMVAVPFLLIGAEYGYDSVFKADYISDSHG